MRLEKIVLREIRLALKEPFRISSGVMSERRILLLELRDADGLVTWAECVAGEMPNYSYETIDTAWLAIREWLAPRVLGVSFESPELLYPVLEKNIAGHHMAKAAIEMGAWAVMAQGRGIPLAELLAGTRERVPTGISIGIQANPEALVQRARRAVADGYRKIKLKIQPGSDIAFVRAVREALGDGVEIMADANSAYSPADGDHLQQLDPFGLLMLEQPLHRDDLYRHSLLQKRLCTPICLDESITDVNRCADMIALKSGRIVNIKPGRVGGFGPSKAIHDLCRASDIPVWCGGMLESGVGRAYNVALASLPNFSLPGDVAASARYFDTELIGEPFTVSADGTMEVPTGPGIGVTVLEDEIRRLALETRELRSGL